MKPLRKAALPPAEPAGLDTATELDRLRRENDVLRQQVRQMEAWRGPQAGAASLRHDDERLATALESLGQDWPTLRTAGPPAEGGAVAEARVREELHLMRLRELREALDARDAFLSVASHELRTPLTTLGLIADGLERGIGTRTQEDLALRARRLRRQVERLDALVDQLIDVSELASGEPELHPEPGDLARLVRSEAERHREYFERGGSELRVHTPRSLPGCWDARRVAQVIEHLLHNAGKYGRGRPVTVRCERGRRHARVEVADQGIGIAPSDQRRIFERFERAVNTRHYGGLGLGLWLTRRLVEAMGGEIRVWSRPGQGARFTVLLALQPEDAALPRHAQS